MAAVHPGSSSARPNKNAARFGQRKTEKIRHAMEKGRAGPSDRFPKEGFPIISPRQT
jgi:hypothetical protein